jgi:hypothetical protein
VASIWSNGAAKRRRPEPDEGERPLTADSNIVAIKDAIRVDESQLKQHIDDTVRSSVEETLNALLDAEADAQCQASRYEERQID